MYPLWHLSLLLFLVTRVFAFVEFAPSCNNHDDVRDALQSVVDRAQTASQFQYLPAAQRPPAGQAPPANQRASALFDDLFDGANSGAQDRLNFIINHYRQVSQARNNPGPAHIKIHCNEDVLNGHPYLKQCVYPGDPNPPGENHADAWTANLDADQAEGIPDVIVGPNIFVCDHTLAYPLLSQVTPQQGDCSSKFQKTLDGNILHEIGHVIGISPPDPSDPVHIPLVNDHQLKDGKDTYGFTNSRQWQIENPGKGNLNADSYMIFGSLQAPKYIEFNWGGDGRAKGF